MTVTSEDFKRVHRLGALNDLDVLTDGQAVSDSNAKYTNTLSVPALWGVDKSEVCDGCQ